jgi:hypothetical protein
MWEQGTLLVNGTSVRYCVKHYPEQSETYGIDGGRISIMELRIGGRVTLSYSRGWDIEPEDEPACLHASPQEVQLSGGKHDENQLQRYGRKTQRTGAGHFRDYRHQGGIQIHADMQLQN